MAIGDSKQLSLKYAPSWQKTHLNILKKTLKNLVQKTLENYTRYVTNAGYLGRFKKHDKLL